MPSKHSKTAGDDPEEEILEIVDKQGQVTGSARRSVLHSDPSLIHRVVHVLVFNNNRDLLIQKRSMNKDVAPGKWDTSVGGHINPGEDPLAAAQREMMEELGITGPVPLEFLYTYLFTNHCESELVSSFRCVYDGAIAFNRDEIDEVQWWNLNRIEGAIGTGVFSSHFEKEMQEYNLSHY